MYREDDDEDEGTATVVSSVASSAFLMFHIYDFFGMIEKNNSWTNKITSLIQLLGLILKDYQTECEEKLEQ